MSFTQEDQQTFFEQTYGCNINDFIEQVEESFTYKMAGKPMVLISLLSDVQEMVAYGDDDARLLERARQDINRIKFLIDRWYSED